MPWEGLFMCNKKCSEDSFWYLFVLAVQTTKKCSFIPFSRVIIKELFKCTGHILRTKDDILPKIVRFGYDLRLKEKQIIPKWVEICHSK